VNACYGSGMRPLLFLALVAVALAQTPQEIPQGQTKQLSKKEKKEAEKRIRAIQKAVQRAGEEAARHVSLPMDDITTGCITLGNMAVHRDTDRVYQDVWGINYIDHVGISVRATASNKCAVEAQISIQARFYDRFGTQVGIDLINAIVSPNGSTPIRAVPIFCSRAGEYGGEDFCAVVIGTARVWMNSSL
jgi:hypothetical protein